jgi:hypothetical protein
MAAAKKNGPDKKEAKTAPGARSMRKAAEEKRAPLQVRSPEQTPGQLIHELRVHRIELEMQAEELRRAHLELAD